jgi:hypothetical protein
VVKRIPRDHKGLLLIPTIFRDKQSKISGTAKMNKNWEKEHQKVLDTYRGTEEFAKEYLASLRRKPK